MKIVSTLPTATEIVFRLGLGNSLVGVSHECNYPEAALLKPRVSETDFDYTNAKSFEIDTYVENKMHNHKSLYKLDEPLITKLSPDVLITQQLCDVCSITPNDIQRVIKNLAVKPELISLNPKNLDDICEEILTVGEILGKKTKAQNLVLKLKKKMKDIKNKTNKLKPKKVFCVEWLSPLFASGHWVPEMVELAGGIEVLGRTEKPSRKISWDKVIDSNPDILILMPCGFTFDKTLSEGSSLTSLPFWEKLTAVKNNQVWVVDGPSYFNQSGPRVIENGIEILAKIIHPDKFGVPSKEEAIKLK